MVARALEIDKETGTTTLRQDAITKKEVATVLPALKIKGSSDTPTVGSTHVDLNIVFDIKMNFSKKRGYAREGTRRTLQRLSRTPAFLSQEKVCKSVS